MTLEIILNYLIIPKALTMRKTVQITTLLLIIIYFFAFMPMTARAENYSDDQIVQAIYHAEGGSRAQYLYGIRSVRYRSAVDARRICATTIRKNRTRYSIYGYKTHKTYIEFLASRYCPLNADNDPKKLNRNWIKNVRHHLTKGKNQHDKRKVKK
jgi:hypothetical protein